MDTHGDTRDVHMQTEGCVRTQGQDRHPQAKDLGLAASRTVRNKCLLCVIVAAPADRSSDSRRKLTQRNIKADNGFF